MTTNQQTMDQKLEHIKTLTAGNNHTGARYYVADLFPYLSLFKRRFELIDKLAEIDGYMTELLRAYRDNITLQMFHEIETNEGFEVKNKIKNCL